MSNEEEKEKRKRKKKKKKGKQLVRSIVHQHTSDKARTPFF